MLQNSSNSGIDTITETSSNSGLECLQALHQKVQWLSAWTIYHANRVRPQSDSLKVGGHQASSASLATVMTALFFDVLGPNDRIAVKPHASPVFHAIQYLLGNQTLDQLQRFRALGGAQAYPSRTKDKVDVDFSTGSVGLGVAMSLFASLTQDYLLAKEYLTEPDLGRMVALLGDAELDEGNIHEALIEGYKQGLRNTWWVIDYNRQSLDSVTPDHMFNRFADIFRTTGWKVITLKYGLQQQAAFAKRGGDALKKWIDACPNALYSALIYKGGGAFRRRLQADIGASPNVRQLLEDYDDAALHDLMTNLGGHDLELLTDTFRSVKSEQPHCFIAYTIKGWGLPIQGHRDNHAGVLTVTQMQTLQEQMRIAAGDEWAPYAGLSVTPARLQNYLDRVSFVQRRERHHDSAPIHVPDVQEFSIADKSITSTQEGFGRIMTALGRSNVALADHIVSASPDVTVSTNLGGWVNQRGVFSRVRKDDSGGQEGVSSMQQWRQSTAGQHFELGIAENNLFLLMAALALSGPLFGERLIPVATLYDPFICRGLDALNYACYQDARFLLVATPSGITLAPEGGAHQSIYTPLIGMGQDKLAYFEPAYVDELTEILRWSFGYMQDKNGGSVYLRLSSRPIAQVRRSANERWRRDLLKGAYWQLRPQPGTKLVLAYTGAVAPEMLSAHQKIQGHPTPGLLAVPSPDRLHKGWTAARRATLSSNCRVFSHVDRLLGELDRDAVIVTVIDGAPETLSWLGAVQGHRVIPLGVEKFGQSAGIDDLYALHGLDADAIYTACQQGIAHNPT